MNPARTLPALLTTALLTLLLPPSLPAAPAPALAATIADLVLSVSPDPAPLRARLSARFLAAVPWEKVAPMFVALHEQHGAVASHLVVEETSPLSCRVELVLTDGWVQPVSLTLRGEPPLVDGLFLHPGRRGHDSWDEIMAELDRLPGSAALTAAALPSAGPITALRVLHDRRGADPMGVGSAFKLYVLGALVDDVLRGRRRFEDVVTLRPEWRSYPSGVLQTWPEGSPVTLHTLAVQMISISDNTATDALILTLGRDRVEAQLPVQGHGRPALMRPMLTVRELFALEAPAFLPLADEWASADEGGRRTILGKLAEAGRPQILEQVPLWTKGVEWFASTRDLCRAMAWLRGTALDRDDPRILPILAVNDGCGLADTAWTYVGFKGGSTKGALNLTNLLQHRSGTWYALSASWNRAEGDCDTSALVLLVQRAARLLAGEAAR